MTERGMPKTISNPWVPHIPLQDFARNLPAVSWKRLHADHDQFMELQSRKKQIRIHGLEIIALPGLYHPHPGSSSDFFIQSVPRFSALRVLDIGTGTGVLGIYLAKQENDVTVTDISEAAIQCAALNARRNGVALTAKVSDLFDAVPKAHRFDRILFNYPFYQKRIERPVEQMVCDPGAQILKRFLTGLDTRLKRGGTTYMTYSNLADAQQLLRLLHRQGFEGFVINYDYDPAPHVVRYVVEIRRARKPTCPQCGSSRQVSA